MDFTFTAELWEWQGQGAWCFVSLPEEYYQPIKELSVGMPKGFGSVRVEVHIGGSTWKTSIFPDTKSRTYLLPVKKAIRTAEKFGVGDSVEIQLKTLDI